MSTPSRRTFTFSNGVSLPFPSQKTRPKNFRARGAIVPSVRGGGRFLQFFAALSRSLINVCNRTCASRKSRPSSILRTQRSSSARKFLSTAPIASRIAARTFSRCSRTSCTVTPRRLAGRRQECKAESFVRKKLAQVLRAGVRAISNGKPWRLLFEGEAHVAIAFFPRSLPAQTTMALRICGSWHTRKFHLGHEKTCTSAAINIDFDHNVVPWISSLPFGSSPELCQARALQTVSGSALILLLRDGCLTHLKREGGCAPLFLEANLFTSRSGCHITLLHNEMLRPLEIIWQPFNQKLPFNFAIVSRSIVPLHRLEHRNELRSVSILSRLAKPAVVEAEGLKRLSQGVCVKRRGVS